MSNSLQPHGLQHSRLPCPSSTPKSLLKLLPIELVILSNHLILCCSLLLLPEKSALCIGWPRYWSFSFSISLSNDCSGLLSFRIDYMLICCSPRDSQESSPTPQFKSINSLACSFLYSPTLTSIHDSGKTIALTRWTFVGK